MSVRFYTSKPNELLVLFEEAITSKKIVTWLRYNDGDFTHTPEDWKAQAYMKPKIYSDALAFGIKKGPNHNLSSKVYGVFHGRLIESFLMHFDAHFSRAEASADFRKADGDLS